jgi:hypothetical protein
MKNPGPHGRASFLFAVFYLVATSMDISPILQELYTMKYDLISVRSTRTPYTVSRPVDIYAELQRTPRGTELG